ncbi:MAG: hypothetical protein BSOLF_1622 [Candidatus Carbobacillus altaicus]|uniref:Uncharacterized protein n=1 Tax=Candidatus Carbonibacillus altaicus TaxID=2163959 RepID=A0A2R6XZ45_9BACL|nr:MAG: hypothetical protein BSOLF_1622 [Candidatus Carbobacillus altaicus]
MLSADELGRWFERRDREIILIAAHTLYESCLDVTITQSASS